MERAITVCSNKDSVDFKELERLRELAKHNEASALANARREADKFATEREGRKWQAIVAEKDATNQAALAEKDAANQAALAEIEELKLLLSKSTKTLES